MGIGLSVLLIAAGAVLTFAVKATVAGLDLDIVGWILMGAGVLGLLWSLVLLSAGRRDVVVGQVHSPAQIVVDSQPVVVRDTDATRDPNDPQQRF